MTKAQSLKLFYQIVRGALNPEDVSRSVKVGDILRESGVLEHSVNKIKQDPGGEEFFQKRNLKFKHDMEFYKSCPKGSLGYVFFLHLVQNKLDPDVLDPIPITDNVSYLENLIREVHDVWHVVVGFDTSLTGEIGLQGFKAQQMNWPFSMVSMGAVCFLTLFKTPDKITELVSEIGRGQRLGQAAQPLIMVDWNRYWGSPLNEVRTLLGLSNSNGYRLQGENIATRDESPTIPN